MAEWLIEHGIGETRAALIADDRIIAAMVERASDGLRCGAVVEARLKDRAQRIAVTGDGTELYVPRWPGAPEGSTVRLQVRRSAIIEAGLIKRPVAEPVSASLPLALGPDIAERAASSGTPVRTVSCAEHAFDSAGWGELLDEARDGIITFPGGVLRVCLTPAMTVIDVDGDASPTDLAHAAVLAVAAAVRRHGLGGNVVIDLPTLPDTAARKAVAATLDTVLAGHPHERTAINGFGLLQIVLPRHTPSLFERVQHAPVETAALGLLRRGERAAGTGLLTLTAHPLVTDWLSARPALLAELMRRTGRPTALQAAPALAMDAGHAQ